ncbi:MAG: PQQ-binding-like beta-propeller repeat protein [Actinomycetia bacterium]|nr:PQQ-binding-like beta-propeller repeat protein [Actinomycetes bacterium]MCP4083806.1 PQQ-binding-like beta-propeller repeat protein [Actinomycetes bacterium]
MNRPTGLTFHRPNRSTKGYTLFTPSHEKSAYLIDMDGRVVHRWAFDTIDPGYGRLLDNGNLLMSGSDVNMPPQPEDEPTKPPPPFELHVTRLGGYKTTLHEVDWDGNLVWSYENRFQHHDFVRLANGNTMVPEWVELSPKLHKAVRGGYKEPREKLPRLLSDDIVEVDPAGQEVRRIHLWELLDPVKDPINPTKRRWEWTHLNGIDVNDAGDIAFSARTNDRVGVIDGATGELKLRFTDVVGQHHVTWVGDDLIQVFDNGRTMSRVLEIQVSTGEITWCYEANPAHQFFSNYMSGADRLWSGSVLVCEGSSGRLFEANRTGEVVWEWINPFVNYRPNGEVAVGLYRAHRYPENHPAFAGRDLDPLAHANLNRLNGLI